MDFARRLWEAMVEKVISPKVDPQRVEACLRRARATLPVPVFWLLGKAQSGKTSLIRALTGSTATEIGNGFRPCTRTAQFYPFPSQQECLVRFLDTRGLGEIDYDPVSDIEAFQQQSHLLIVVVRAMDHAQHCVLEALRAIRASRPEWPLIVVQSALHDGYRPPQSQHVLPYPYGESPMPGNVPDDLARSLAVQRAWFDPSPLRFVPLDFTLPEDGYQPEDYGLDALWAAIEEALPLGLRGMLQQASAAWQPLRDEYFHAAHPQVLYYSVAAGIAGAVPVPLVDIPLVLAIQGKLFHTIASIYQQELSGRRITEVGGSLGAGYLLRYLARLASRDLLKVIPVPGLGSAAAGLYSAACTYALGRTLCAYFSHVLHGDIPDDAMLRKFWTEQYEEGRRRLGDYLTRATTRKEAQP